MPCCLKVRRQVTTRCLPIDGFWLSSSRPGCPRRRRMCPRISPFYLRGETPEWLEQDGLEGLLLDEDTLSVTFPVTVPADGLYELEVMYYPYGGSGQAIRRTVSVDGTPPSAKPKTCACTAAIPMWAKRATMATATSLPTARRNCAAGIPSSGRMWTANIPRRCCGRLQPANIP